MKRFLCLLLACICLTTLAPAALAAEDYTVAGKLLKQLWAGSGFSGVLTFEMTGMSKPAVVDLDYIYVREAPGVQAEHRADLTLMEGESAVSAAHVQVKGGDVALQADLISPDWYSFADTGKPGDTAQTIDSARSGALAYTGMPSLSQTALAVLASLQNAEGVDAVIDNFTLRTDIWIEGYRQNAILGKLDDGTSTMEVHYCVPPAAIKAQAKSMLLDLLGDEAALAILREAMGDEAAALYLDPSLQAWYFECIDALPLSGDLLISRTVSLKGETISLSLDLPLYDAESGAVLLSYQRTRGEGDLPDANLIRLQSAARVMEVEYQEYSSMTGVEVIRGSFSSEPADVSGFSVSDATGPEPLCFTFTLSQQHTETRDDQLRDVYGYDLSLTLAPVETGDFEEIEIALHSTFASKELKSAATEMKADVSITSGDTAIAMTFEGASRKKWDVEELPAGRIYVREMTQSDWTALLPGAALRAAALFNGYLDTPAETAK